MATLNRSSFWTLPTGEKIRVKRMSIEDIHIAMFIVDAMERENIGNDPYLIQQMCLYSGACPVLLPIEEKISGFYPEDWHDLFLNEIDKRFKFLERRAIKTQKVNKKPSWLVKWFKFW